MTKTHSAKADDTAPVVLWFRNDLRLSDHVALSAAFASGVPVIPLFILDDASAESWAPGGASRWWLGASLAELSRQLETLGSKLILRRGKTVPILQDICDQTGASAVYCSRAYEPFASQIERDVKAGLEVASIEFKRFPGALLKEPEAVKTKTGEPYKVYTPFWRALSDNFEPHEPAARPKKILQPSKWPASDNLQDWQLSPTKPDWSTGMRAAWQPGENGAQARLETFLNGAVRTYTEERNRPDMPGTSRLSPHLHFGEISPRVCWRRAAALARAKPAAKEGVTTFLKELTWREFSYSLLHHWPDLPQAPFRKDFSRFPWVKDRSALKAWQHGQTGYPVVDAGMRELWTTGYMHNRIRMVAASFLIKHLLIPWQEGEEWFWDTLVDADLANNAASWQWVAGSGADAAPYFRIFNPVTQGQKFDPEGAYVRRWVPELAKLPNALIHAPWEAPAEILAAAGVSLGSNYPMPIVDHATARKRALDAYETVKTINSVA